MYDNLSYMKNFKPLNKEEMEIIKKAQEILKSSKEISCTGCRYCVDGCPKKIPIPDIFAARNKQLGLGLIEEGKKSYKDAVKGKGKPADCLKCKKCQGVCPQQLPIIDLLKECDEAFK